jgi:hypothetical protein
MLGQFQLVISKLTVGEVEQLLEMSRAGLAREAVLV